MLLDDVILDEEEFILDEFCNLDVAEMDDEEDTDEFADELPESVDDITPEDGYDGVFVGQTAAATSILFEEC